MPAETRRMLRERLRRFLPAYSISNGRADLTVSPPISDKEFVELLINLEFLPGDDASQAQGVYEEAAQRQALTSSELRLDPVVPLFATATNRQGAPEETNRPAPDYEASPSQISISVQITPSPISFDGLFPPPSFNELLARGWIRRTWGQVVVAADLGRATCCHSQAVGTAFKELVETQHQDVFKFRDGFNPRGDLQVIANGILAGQFRPNQVACIARPWIAARVWDTPIYSSNGLGLNDPQLRLSRWIHSWQLLNSPSFQLSSYLESVSFCEFVETSLAALSQFTVSPSWSEFREAARAPIILLYPHRAADAESVVSSVPTTTIERVDWMSRRLTEQTYYEYLGTKGSGLMNVLLNEIQDATFDPNHLASRLMVCVVERPVLLQQLVMRVRQAPVLLADMLMASSTCVLACSLIASWNFNPGGWNRAFQAQANDTTVMLAFEDAIALLGGHLDANKLPAIELAALYRYIYNLAS